MLRKIIEASIEAGKAILEVYETADFGVEFKKDDSPLTNADKQSNNVIEQYLKSTPFPVLSEEGRDIDFEERSKWKTFWLVDPLDGTKEFIKRNGEFTVNIALIEQDTPIMGVVYVPVTGDLYFADINGAFKARVEEEYQVDLLIQSAQQLPFSVQRNKFIVVGSRSHMSADTENYINKIDTLGKPIEMMPKGSSLKICMVAEGSADCYPRLGPTMEWDTAAGHAIAKYAGCNFLQYKTEDAFVYNKQNLLNPWFVVNRSFV